MRLRNAFPIYTIVMSPECHFRFSCANIVSIWFWSASRMSGRAVPAPHQLPIQPVT